MPDAPWTTIPELVDHAALRFADDEALIEDETRWSFTELAERIHEVARALMASSVDRGDRIAIWAPNISEWVVAALAVHSVGAWLVPVNTRFKGREARDVMRRSNVRLLFTVTDFLDTDFIGMARDDGGVESLDEIVVLHGSVPDGATRFVDFLARAAAVDDAARAERAAEVQGDDVCHVLFTSGTTGAPKGAMLTHEQVCRAYLVFSDVIGLREGDRYLIVLPFFHSFGLHAGIICCLMKGATIVPLQVFEPAATMRFIAEERITAFPGAPAIYQAMLNHPDVDGFDLSSLRLAILGAASIPVELIEQMRGRLGLECVVSGFGITESSGIVSMCRYDDPPDIIAHTCGRPLPGLEVRVVDDEGVEAPPETPGEIFVRGYTLMRGYLDDPKQTEAAIDSDGWLHTGDIGVMRADGNLVITDRKKDMFVVGGFNVYPAEVESLMSAHPAIGQVAVVGMPDERLGEVGIAYVIPRPNVAVDPDEIMAWCREEMANYKVPRAVETVDELPLNASGKVLKYELRERAAARSAT
jgi:acyl-CoA synthetase (AMP-forming)/AMP-acid ligase II